jgi:hypothetical protein
VVSVGIGKWYSVSQYLNSEYFCTGLHFNNKIDTMSYRYRYDKRKACHFILKYLVENDVQRDSSWEPVVDRDFVSIKTFVKNSKYDYNILYPAVYLLARNKHIEHNDPNGFLDDNTNIELLPLGKDV